MKTTIAEVHKYVDQEVTIGAWLANKRSSGKIAFLQLRDGSGFMQGVVVKAKYRKKYFKLAKVDYARIFTLCNRHSPEDERSPFGYELACERN